jgi:hypothetical protein
LRWVFPASSLALGHDLVEHGLHSLRHFYACWCINRTKDGGLELPPKSVQRSAWAIHRLSCRWTCTATCPQAMITRRSLRRRSGRCRRDASKRRGPRPERQRRSAQRLTSATFDLS